MSAQLAETSNQAHQKYRLITRSDFDGVVCAALLQEVDLIDEIIFVHLKNIQDGKIDISSRDILANLPYVSQAHLVFSYHETASRQASQNQPANFVINTGLSSAAQVIYNYYGGQDAFPNINEEMMREVDRAGATDYSRKDILSPKGWVLLNYLLDSRSGLCRYKNFRIPQNTLMIKLADYCRSHTIEEIIALPDVQERVDLYFRHQKAAMHQIEKCSKIYGNVIVLDLRNEKEIYVANRFIIYAMFEECDISIHILWKIQKQYTVLAISKSILHCESDVHLGTLMQRYGGGGYDRAGACQIPCEKTEQVLQEIIAELRKDEPVESQKASVSLPDAHPVDSVLEELPLPDETDEVIEQAKSQLLRPAAISSSLLPGFIAAPLTGVSPLTVQLDASTSTVAEDRHIVSYQWRCSASIEIADGIHSSVTIKEPGDYAITLRITDNTGHSAHDIKIVTVLSRYRPAIPMIDASPTEGPAPLTVKLDASRSMAPERGMIQQYLWTVNEQRIPGKFATLTLTECGEYNLMLSLTDDQGSTTTAEKTLVVTPPIETEVGRGNNSASLGELHFTGQKKFYGTQSVVLIDLVTRLRCHNQYQRVDLWIAVQTPAGDLYYMTVSPFQQFSHEPLPFRTSLEGTAEATFRVLEFNLLDDMPAASICQFYAFYNREGADLSQLLFTQRSNLARIDNAQHFWHMLCESSHDTSNCVIYQEVMPHLRFTCYQELYRLGEQISIDLSGEIPEADDWVPVDLWVATETPDGQIYYMIDSPFEPFSSVPCPMKSGLQAGTKIRLRVTEFENAPGMGGNYSFYAVLTTSGEDLSNLLLNQRSNIAFAMVMLSHR